MDRKKEVKKNIDSHHFMDKILTKLKMGKHGGEEKVTGSSGCKRLKSCESSSSSKDTKPLITWENNKVTPDNIMEFSDQLHHLLDYVQNLKDVVFYTYEYPNVLNEKLEKEATELRNLFRDVRAAAIDIERLQKQRYLIKKEKCLATKKLDKLKEDEIRELESIICAYAKPLHSKWETIKNSQKPDVLENFMNEVTGKHRAIEILQELVRRKLSKVSKKNSAAPITLKKNISSTFMNNKFKNPDRPNWNIAPFPVLDKFNPNMDKVRATPDRDVLRMNRRKRQKELREERRRQSNDSGNSNNLMGSSVVDNNGALELQLTALDNFHGEEIDDVVKTTAAAATTTTAAAAAAAAAATTRTPPIINIEYTSDDDSVSLSSSDFMIENFVQGGNTEIHTDLQHEMRNVLQALFGEIRQLPQLGGFSTRNRHNNSGNDLRSPRTASN